jgi:hypothetical protein
LSSQIELLFRAPQLPLSLAHSANFLRHFGRLINRCLIAHSNAADTTELAYWAYGEVLPRYARQNVRRHCLAFGIPRVGKRSRLFVWALRKAPDIEDYSEEAGGLFGFQTDRLPYATIHMFVGSRGVFSVSFC